VGFSRSKERLVLIRLEAHSPRRSPSIVIATFTNFSTLVLAWQEREHERRSMQREARLWWLAGGRTTSSTRRAVHLRYLAWSAAPPCDHQNTRCEDDEGGTWGLYLQHEGTTARPATCARTPADLCGLALERGAAGTGRESGNGTAELSGGGWGETVNS